MSVFQDLYHSEINFDVSTFWDRGFDVKLGDAMNGIKAETTVRRWGEVEPWLTAAAIEHFPDSLFARMYRDGAHAYLAEPSYNPLSKLPPEELTRLQREKTRQMRAVLDRLMAVEPDPTPLSKEKRG